MRNILLSLFCIIALSLFLSGCATINYPNLYKVEGKEFQKFQELDDESALKLVALIYNVRCEGYEENTTRNIALGEYIRLLAKRKTKYIIRSGIFDVKYSVIKLSEWKDDDLIRFYRFVAPKASQYYTDKAPDLSDQQNAERLMYLTAVSTVKAEIKKRSVSRKALMLAGQLLVGALSIGLALL